MTNNRIACQRSLVSALVIGLGLIPGAAHAARADQTITYYLPKAVVGVSLTRTLKACPTKDHPELLIKSEWVAAADAVPDPAMLVHVDVSSGFLAKRSHAFTYHANGTLAEFNSTSEGQGGAVLASVFKAASFVLPLASGVGLLGGPGPKISPTGPLYCSKPATAALARVAELDEAIEKIGGKVDRGEATAADLRALDLLKARRTEVRKPLVKAAPTILEEQGNLDLKGSIKALPLETWFVSDQEQAAPDAVAFERTIEPIKQLGPFEIEPQPAFVVERPTLSVTRIDPTARRALVYRRPVFADVIVRPSGCTTDACMTAIELEAPLAIPQWGKIEELSVGHGGLFGSRQAKAKFDAFGSPVELSFGSDSGAAGIAGTIDAATATGEALRDAEAAALKRQIEKIELRQKLRDLQAAESN